MELVYIVVDRPRKMHGNPTHLADACVILSVSMQHFHNDLHLGAQPVPSNQPPVSTATIRTSNSSIIPFSFVSNVSSRDNRLSFFSSPLSSPSLVNLFNYVIQPVVTPVRVTNIYIYI